MDNKLTIEEKRALQLEMLDEIHKVCARNDIKYSLAYGTLLGAIRHQGFIPWDDDMDIMMPYLEMMRFRECLQSENIEYLDSTNCTDFEWFFSRIVSKKTYSSPGKFIKSYGVNIDLYPVVFIKTDNRGIDNFLIEGQKLNQKANHSIVWRNRLMKYLSIKWHPFFRRDVLKLRNYVMEHANEESPLFFSTGGSFKCSNIFCEDLFKDIIPLKFENREYMCISSYDAYLSQIYGDYMTPPPEEKRVPYHGGTYYWR